MNRRGFLKAVGAIPAGAVMVKLPVLLPDAVPALVAQPGLSLADIISTTLRARSAQIIENVTRHSVLLDRLLANGERTRREIAEGVMRVELRLS